MRRAPAVTLALAAALAACATSEPPAKPESSVSATAQAADAELEFGRTLQDLDKRVDRSVYLASQSGDDAREEAGLLGPALQAQVAQHRERLIALAGDATQPEKRRIAAKSLAFCDDPRAVPVLVDALAVKGDERLLTNATFALAKIGSPAIPTEPLLKLVSDPDPFVRGNALMALWHVFDAKRSLGASPLDPVTQGRAMPIFEAALFDPADPVIRAHAAAALGALGDPRAVDPLLNLLRDEHPLVRTQTAIALSKLGDLRAIEPLVKVIDETPRGTPKTAVLLALTVLLEKSGRNVPDNLGDAEHAWDTFVRERYGPPGKPFPAVDSPR